MYWDINKADTYTLYSPLNDVEADFISALSSIDLSANHIIDASKIAFTESVKLALSNCNKAHLEVHKSFVVVVGNMLSMSDLEELFVVVPTISEAIDYIYMEELEKNL
ncbi:MAG: hypothetical protein CND86_05395 [Bacteroidetes bacterium MED-G21]|nr:MAG: hypothetical protein CND86_05395 [Bacteroidetes bacterium MED-G21]